MIYLFTNLVEQNKGHGSVITTSPHPSWPRAQEGLGNGLEHHNWPPKWPQGPQRPHFRPTKPRQAPEPTQARGHMELLEAIQSQLPSGNALPFQVV